MLINGKEHHPGRAIIETRHFRYKYSHEVSDYCYRRPKGGYKSEGKKSTDTANRRNCVAYKQNEQH